MEKTSTKIIVAVLLVSILLGSLTTAYSLLSRKDYSVIRIAFMNGYLEALKLDVEQIKKMENDKVLLSKTVKAAAENYLTRVEGLNQ